MRHGNNETSAKGVEPAAQWEESSDKLKAKDIVQINFYRFSPNSSKMSRPWN